MSYLQRAATLTDVEWRFIVSLLATEYDANENPLAISSLKKISGVSSTGSDKDIPSAVRFFAADEDTRNRGMNGRVGKMATKAGFAIEHTGGGVYLWHKSIADDHFMYLSGGDCDLGERIDEPFGLGVYTNDGEQIGWLECANLHDALDRAAECERDVAAFVKKNPFN